MSKRQFKSQASSGRAPSAFGGFGSSGFGSSQSSVLSYIQEPPDFSGISDSNVVVAFKNLSKKDATTKAKALEDLQAHVNTPEVEVEDGFLEAWVRFHALVYAELDSDKMNLGEAIPSPLDRLCTSCKTAHAHSQRSSVLKMWKKDREASA